MPNISRSKGDQTMKFDELIEYNKNNNFIQKPYENVEGKLSPGLFLFYTKALYKFKASGKQLSFAIYK